MKKIITLSLGALLLTTASMSYASHTVKCPTATITFKRSGNFYDHWTMIVTGHKVGIYTIASTDVELHSKRGTCTYTPDGKPLTQNEPKVLLLYTENLQAYGDHWTQTSYNIKTCIEKGTVDYCLFQTTSS